MASGVREYSCVERSLNAVCFKIETTSEDDNCGFAEITRPAMPATSGAALDVPPNVSVIRPSDGPLGGRCNCVERREQTASRHGHRHGRWPTCPGHSHLGQSLFIELAAWLRPLADQARAGKLADADMQGSVFTITNLQRSRNCNPGSWSHSPRTSPTRRRAGQHDITIAYCWSHG